MCASCGCASNTKVSIHNLQTGKETALVSGARPHHHEHPSGHAEDRPENRGRHDHSIAEEGLLHAGGSMNASLKKGDGADHNHVHSEGVWVEHVSHSHADLHSKDGGGGAVVDLETRILVKNDAFAAKNRAWFADHDILAFNVLSSPGAGKTTLLERAIRDLKDKLQLLVIEGDQATTRDGERIRNAGAPVVQVNTGAGCHLEADMVARGLVELAPPRGALVIIENVGNLVCPALFDLGEGARVLVFSIVEGEDKPLKYPHMFRSADIVLLNKIDLLPYVEFDLDCAIANVRQVNGECPILQVSARTGEGLDLWYQWIDRKIATCKVESV